ncbi:MAG: hypothetical protein KKA42_11980, partial [candidate division Zixibacteria bacterium]|nr:hypothetical protein [candidate division Zixibacteria bacterium]
MTKFLTVCLVIAILTCSALAGEREDRHEQRINGLDLSSRQLTADGIVGQAASAADFTDQLVSRSFAPARFRQQNAAVLARRDGGWLVAWQDERLGADKIFWQRFTALGEPDGDNVVAASSGVGSDFVEVNLAADTSGRVYLFWRDRTGGLIYGSRYNSDLTANLPTFLVNDTSSESFAGPFDLAVFPDGQVVVVWENYDASGSTIAMRLFSPSGASVVGPVTVNLGGGAAQHWVPTVAVAPGSGFLVAWEDYRNGRADIYARLYTGSGAPSSVNDFAVVPAPFNTAAQYAPSVAWSSVSQYAIGWLDTRLGREVYVQKFDHTLGLVGSNKQVSAGDTLLVNWNLSLSTRSDDQVVAAWATSGLNSRIMGVRLDTDLTPVGSPSVRNLAASGQRWSPNMAFADDKTQAIVWTEVVNSDPDIHVMLFDAADDRLLGAEVRANTDDRGAPSTHPSLVHGATFYHLVGFADQRNDAGDIFVKAISYAGIAATHEHRVNQDADLNLQTEPSLAVSADRSLVVWVDSRPVVGATGQRIFGRFGSLLGEFSNDEFLVSDTGATAVKQAPSVAMRSTGRGLVTWLDHRSGEAAVYGRWLASDGSLDGHEITISSAPGDSAAGYVHTGVDDAGRFHVTWLDLGMTTPT